MTLDPLAAVGLIGTAIIMTAYLANQRGQLASDDPRFPLANLAGSLLILTSFTTAWNLPGALIEVFWSAISLYGFLRARTQRTGS